MRWVALFVATIAGAGALAGLGLWVFASGLFMLGIGVPAMVVLNQRFRPTDGSSAAPPRPDADVAQYLNDEDREWLRDNGDWTDPRASTNSTGWPVVDRISDENGWRTIHYSDGSTEQYAVTDWDRTHPLVAEIRADNERVADSFEQWTERQAADAPDPGPVPDGDYETIVDGLGRPVRYVQT